MKILEIPEQKHAMPNRWLVWAVVVLAVGLFVILLPWRSSADVVAAAQLATVTQGDIAEEVVAYGRLVSRNPNVIVAKVDGIVEKINAYPGKRVKRGELLLKLANPSLVTNWKNEQMNAVKAQAEAKSALAELEIERVRLQNEVEILTNTVELRALELNKLKALRDKNVISELKYLQSANNLQEAKLKLALAKKNLAIFQQALDAKKQAIEQSLAVALQRADIAKKELDELAIIASRDGVLREFDIQLGSAVTRNQKIAIISDQDELYADLLVTAAEAEKLRVGQRATIVVGQAKVPGEVMRVHPVVENNQVQIEVRPTAPIPGNRKENLDVAAYIVVAEKKHTTVLARPEGVDMPFQTYTLNVVREDALVPTSVRVGMIDKRHIEIVSGLKVGDRVMIAKEEN
ncbi:MAG: HlyD family efflux transporter periplasmic adaptor subunit [Gammaproteobacteria bacterium]|nr:MAG: HlyD family efflux transporter periplasmic adaptor subunit [Gammaproteobacteria bacterium]